MTSGAAAPPAAVAGAAARGLQPAHAAAARGDAHSTTSQAAAAAAAEAGCEMPLASTQSVARPVSDCEGPAAAAHCHRRPSRRMCAERRCPAGALWGCHVRGTSPCCWSAPGSGAQSPSPCRPCKVWPAGAGRPSTAHAASAACSDWLSVCRGRKSTPSACHFTSGAGAAPQDVAAPAQAAEAASSTSVTSCGRTVADICLCASPAGEPHLRHPASRLRLQGLDEAKSSQGRTTCMLMLARTCVRGRCGEAVTGIEGRVAKDRPAAPAGKRSGEAMLHRV